MTSQEMVDTEIEADEPAPDTIEHEDGSVTILDDTEGEPDAAQFDLNLSLVVSERVLGDIAGTLLDLIEQDIKSREKRDKQYEEALKRSGLGHDAPGGAEFEGASKVVHPMIAEACVDFAAAAIKELYPPDGPVRPKIVGANMTPERMEKAERKARHMNWQLTEQVKEYPHELEQLLTQVPMGGSQFMKGYWDAGLGRPCAEAVFVDDVFLPYNAKGFYSSDRVTHRQYLSSMEFQKRVKSGFYRDIDVRPSPTAELSKSAEANNKIEGREPTGEDDDELIEYEVYTDLDLEGEDPLADGLAPYIVTIDKQSRQIAALYRNWEESDKLKRKLDWLVEFPFIPWRGALAIGFWQLVSGLSTSATGALRALLDSAHINNAATGLKIGGSRTGGQTTTPSIGEIATVESAPVGSGDPDIRKVVMAMPFNPPSVVLFQLLGWLTDAGKGVISTAEEKIADASNNMPVGTAQALIEQGAKVFSSIHARLHRAQARFLAIIHRLNRDYLDDAVTLAEAGELLASRKDYEGPLDIIPVSDPNIFSQTQRYAQAQALVSRAEARPDLYDARAVEKRFLQIMNVPNLDEVFPEPPKPHPTDPISENLMMASGMKAQAFPGQDHLGHLMIHLAFLDDPLLGGSPVIGQTLTPPGLEHLAQHLGLFYAEGAFAGANIPFQPGQMLPPQMDMQVTRRLGAAVGPVQAFMGKNLVDLPDVIQKALQRLKLYNEIQRSITPTPPDDPLARATIDGSLAETARKARKDAADVALKERDLDIEEERVDIERDRLDVEEGRELVDAAHQEQQQHEQRVSFEEALDDDDDSPSGHFRARR